MAAQPVDLRDATLALDKCNSETQHVYIHSKLTSATFMIVPPMHLAGIKYPELICRTFNMSFNYCKFYMIYPFLAQYFIEI